jgi:alpha-D-ribose 1-methylphosphonate 5-triphosphate synthase subunit PhnL
VNREAIRPVAVSAVGLRCEGVVKTFRGWGPEPVEALRGVAVSVKPGVLTLVRGARSCGRTTLLRCLYGTYRPDSGRVLVSVGEADELDLVTAPERTVAWLRRTYLATFDGVLVAPPRTTARHVVARAGGTDEAGTWLATVGAEAWAEVPIGRLRPDERRRVALAAALATPAPVLLLDEPLAGLQPAVAMAVSARLAERLSGGGAVLATAGDADRVIGPLASINQTLEHGRITCTK